MAYAFSSTKGIRYQSLQGARVLRATVFSVCPGQVSDKRQQGVEGKSRALIHSQFILVLSTRE